MTEVTLKPIQGLYSPERPCEKFWSLLAKIELSSFRKNEPYSSKKKRRT